MFCLGQQKLERCSPLPEVEVEFRPLEEADLPLLTGWLGEPHVRTFYQKMPVTFTQVALEYGPFLRHEEPTLCHLALNVGVPFAYLQCYRNSDYPKWAEMIGAKDGVSVDMFVGEPGYLGRGFGRAALAKYLKQVVFPFHPRETRTYIAHDQLNEAALQCSQAVGFERVGTFLEDGAEMVLLMKLKPSAARTR